MDQTAHPNTKKNLEFFLEILTQKSHKDAHFFHISGIRTGNSGKKLVKHGYGNQDGTWGRPNAK